MEKRKEEELKNKVSQQNDSLRECLKITHETVTISNETNKELHKQGGK